MGKHAEKGLPILGVKAICLFRTFFFFSFFFFSFLRLLFFSRLQDERFDYISYSLADNLCHPMPKVFLTYGRLAEADGS